MRPLPTRCPLTGGPLVVTKIYSPEGDFTMEGRFEVNSPFLALTPEQVRFVLTLIQCEGKFNRMQEELGLSYPTLRARLRRIISDLGLEVADDGEYLADESARLEILSQVNEGQIDVATALKSLHGE